MATKVEAAHTMMVKAARMKDTGQRMDVEAGMAKMLASEYCHEVVEDSFRIHGGYGYSKEYEIERLYREVAFMLIGEGTSRHPEDDHRPRDAQGLQAQGLSQRPSSTSHSRPLVLEGLPLHALERHAEPLGHRAARRVLGDAVPLHPRGARGVWTAQSAIALAARVTSPRPVASVGEPDADLAAAAGGVEDPEQRAADQLAVLPEPEDPALVAGEPVGVALQEGARRLLVDD